MKVSSNPAPFAVYINLIVFLLYASATVNRFYVCVSC